MTNHVKIDARIVGEFFARFISQSPLWFDGNSGVVSVNTQARRLGCFVYILGQVASGRRIESLLLSPSSQELADLKRNLDQNSFTSGHLTQKASSVKHYLDAAVELHLVVRQGSVFSLTGRGQFLLEALHPNVATPYPLAPATRVFFLHTLLVTDYFGISAIVRSLLEGKKRMSVIQREHRSQLLRLLADVSRHSTSTRLNRLAQDRIISIQHWRKPASYAEHLVSAKLNWLADLGILEAAPSSDSSILIKKEHENWLDEFAKATPPSESHLVAFILNYCSAISTNEQPCGNRYVCAALDSAFERLAGQATLRKIRCSEFILFLLCFHAPMLETMLRNGERLLGDSAIQCGQHEYKIHFASRPTQSFIVCQQK